MHRNLATLLLFLFACGPAPDEASQATDARLRSRERSFAITLTPGAPSALLSFPAEAPASFAALEFELAESDLERLASLSPAELDPETAAALGGNQATTAAWVGFEAGPFRETAYPLDRALAWVFEKGQRLRVQSSWMSPTVTRGDSFRIRVIRSAELPTTAFPRLDLTVKVRLQEYDPHNPCFGEPEGQSVCCDQDRAICRCEDGQPIVDDYCRVVMGGLDYRTPRPSFCSITGAPGWRWAECNL